MRVMCISPINKPAIGCETMPRPEVGVIDVVINERQAYGLMYYSLERFSPDLGYLAENFAILSDQPEEVIEEELTNA